MEKRSTSIAEKFRTTAKIKHFSEVVTQNSASGCRRLITYSMSEYEMKQSICFSFRILQKLNIKIFRQCSPKLPKKTQSELEFQTYLRASVWAEIVF